MRKFPIKPGKQLAADMAKSGMSPARLSALTGVPKGELGIFLRGNSPCTAQLAIRLEKALGIPAKYWLMLQVDYELALERVE